MFIFWHNGEDFHERSLLIYQFSFHKLSIYKYTNPEFQNPPRFHDLKRLYLPTDIRMP